jgi:hypothetical protein
VADELPLMVGESAAQLVKEHGATLESLRSAAKEDQFRGAGDTPLNVWHFKTPKGESRYAVFYGPSVYSIPGTAWAEVILLSPAGKEIGRWRFPIGWRMFMTSASTFFDESLQAQIVTVATAPSINGQDVARQHFALVDDKLYFIRMEDSKGRLIRNDYLYPNFTLGGITPAKDVPGWTSLSERKFQWFFAPKPS